jgi:pyruvate,water dikinase
MLAAGVVGNPTTQISVGVDNLIAAARPLSPHFASGKGTLDLLQTLRAHAEQDGMVKDWLARFDAFLARSGHRAPQELELSVPRWIEGPSMILELVRAGLEVPAREGVEDRLGRLRAESEAHVAAAVAAAPVWKRPLMRGLARAVRAYMPLREAPKHHAMQMFLRTRGAAQELGRRLAARGLLSTLDDVFFFALDELDTLLRAPHEPPLDDPREIVARRRQELASSRTRQAPALVRSDGVPVEVPEDADSTNPAADGSLHGIGVGGGRGEGPVRVLRSPDPRKFTEGDVLVMAFADPGWTPLFPRAAAIVMEVGGTMCHAAVVARELGIPAVFGVKNATQLLKDGEWVTVEGDEGAVHRCASPAEV